MNIQEEKQVLHRIKGGDSDAYRLFVDEYSDRIFSLVHKIISSSLDAEDICQEVFVKAFFRLNKFKGESSFYSWLYRIAYNESISFIRKNRGKNGLRFDVEMNERLLADLTNENCSVLEKERIYKVLSNSMHKLDADELFLIDGFYYKGMNLKDLCIETGLNESNIKVRLFRIKKKLNKIMRAELSVL